MIQHADRIASALVAALACTAALPAPAAERGAAASAPVSEYEFRLPPGKSEEICLKLERGKGFDFRFNADAPVDFNVHYHVGQKIVMPLQAPAVMHQVGRFVAKHAGEHCMMWTATAAGEAGVLGKWQPYAKR
jgi:hypothetical protein